jgi:undecaprenyl-diphosphatase
MIEVFGVSSVILGSLVAACAAALAVKFLVNYLSRHGLGIFAVYRLALAGVLGSWFLMNE